MSRTRLLEKIKSPHHLRQQIGGIFFLCLVVFSRPTATPIEELWIIPAGLLFFLSGLAGRAWSSGFLVKNDLLTTTGPYGRVRNPIYVANLLLGAGLVLLSGHYWAAVLLGLLYAVCYVPGMRVEEENLRRRYGAAFDQYARSVPLIVPGPRIAPGFGGGAWSARAFHENKELPVTIGLLLGLGIVLWKRCSLCVS